MRECVVGIANLYFDNQKSKWEWTPCDDIREEIIRCMDCEHCTEEGIYTPQYYCNNRRWHYLSWQGTPTEPDGFCKWGKRRNNND